MCQGDQGSRGTLHKTGLYFMGIYALICYSLDEVMLWGTFYKLAELILSCVLLRTSSSGLRLRQDVLYRSHNATRFARRAHFYNSSLSLVHVFLLYTTSPTYSCQHGQDTTQEERQGSLSAR